MELLHAKKNTPLLIPLLHLYMTCVAISESYFPVKDEFQVRVLARKGGVIGNARKFSYCMFPQAFNLMEEK